jgi:hypothetical protein
VVVVVIVVVAYACRQYRQLRAIRQRFHVLRFAIPWYIVKLPYVANNYFYHRIRDHFVRMNELDATFRFDAYLRRCAKQLFTELAQVHWSVLGGVLLMQITIWIALTHWGNHHGAPYTVVQAIVLVAFLLLYIEISFIFDKLVHDNDLVLKRVVAPPATNEELESRASLTLERHLTPATQDMEHGLEMKPIPPEIQAPLPPLPPRSSDRRHSQSSYRRYRAKQQHNTPAPPQPRYHRPSKARRANHKRNRSEPLQHARRHHSSNNNSDDFVHVETPPPLVFSDPIDNLLASRRKPHPRRKHPHAQTSSRSPSAGTASYLSDTSNTRSPIKSKLSSFKSRLDVNSLKHKEALLRAHQGATRRTSGSTSGMLWHPDLLSTSLTDSLTHWLTH